MPDIFQWPADKKLPRDFLARLKILAEAGNVFVYPTSTLYGMGASCHSEKGIRKVLELKSRPSGMPLPVMAAPEQIEGICILPEIYRPFMNSIRVTAILRATENVRPALVHNGTLAVRIPCSELTASLVDSLGPVTSTSANLHGHPTPADIGTLANQFGERISLYIDSGKLEGLPTTLIDFTGDRPKIIREGALSREEMERMHE